MSKEKKTIEPINASLDDVASSLMNKNEHKIPFTKWKGIIDLGGNLIDCYVLNNEQRVIGSGSATKAIANIV